MARPINADAAVTRARILDAALELFANRGFYGTSMRQIGAASGVTGSALYHHFENKDAILHAVVGELRALADAQLQQVAQGMASQQVTSLVGLFRRVATQLLALFELPLHRKMFQVVMTDGPRLRAEGVFNAEELVAAQRARVAGILGALMEAGMVRKVDPGHAAMMLMGPLLVYRQFYIVWGTPVADRREREGFIKDYSETMARALSPDRDPLAPKSIHGY